MSRLLKISFLITAIVLLAAACNNQAAVQPDQNSTVVQKQPTETPAPAPTPTPSPVSTDQTANWKTYTNVKYGFEFKYPANLQVENPQDLDQYIVIKPVSEKALCLDANNSSSANCPFLIFVNTAPNASLSTLEKISTESHEIMIGGKKATSFTDPNEQIIAVSLTTGILTLSYDNKFKNSTNDQTLTSIISSFKFTK